MSWPILSVSIVYEQDVVVARQRARQIAGLLGFDAPDQTRIATAVSEIARNAYNYASNGRVEFYLEGQTQPQLFLIQVEDKGPGIADMAAILRGEYRSETGLGLGIVGARRLMDQFELESVPGAGTKVWLKKLLPRKASLVTPEGLQKIAAHLAQERPQNPVEEVQQQNQELLRTLEELRQRQDSLIRLNRELEDTNRGVVALYAELDEKAGHLRQADKMKSRFLSNMSHEFRTPLNSILGLSRLLLNRTDGDLTSEQEKQVRYIRQAGEELLELVNDLLDLAKIEAGKIEVRPAEFSVANLFSALRGMLRPLLLNEAVNLIFEEAEDVPLLCTDEGKVSQILRNFLSNALKFTERGEVRVMATFVPERQSVILAVADTGIGIEPEDQARIFEEFTQVEHPLQRRVKGTGLGLPLCRTLAGLLGGKVWVESQVGIGSTFFAEIPLRYIETAAEVEPVPAPWVVDPARLPVLVVEDDISTRLIYEKFLKGSPFQFIPAYTMREAQQAMQQFRPKAIILDILLPDQAAWNWLAQLKDDENTSRIPIVVVTTLEDAQKGLALGADVYKVKPVERDWLLAQLTRLTKTNPQPTILLIDDEPTARYVLAKMLASPNYQICEASDGPEGLRGAVELQPVAIFLDLIMPGMTGFEVLERLKADPTTSAIPVVIVTSRMLRVTDRDRLAQAAAILTKESLSPELLGETLRQIELAAT